MNNDLSSNFNFCLSNILIFHFINENVKNIGNNEIYGIYIRFFNHPNNEVPESFLENKEVLICLQKRFENLHIDCLNLYVTIYIQDKPINIKIDLFTVIDVRLGRRDMTYNLNFSYRTTPEYANMISHIDIKAYSDTVYSILKSLKDSTGILRLDIKEDSKAHKTQYINFDSINEDKNA